MRAWQSTCLPALKGGQREGAVHIRPGSDQDRVHAIIVQQFLPTTIRPRNIELVGYTLTGRKTAIRHGDNLASRDLPKGWKHHVPDIRARPDDSDADGILGRPLPWCPLRWELCGARRSHKWEGSHGKKLSAIQSPSSLAAGSVAHYCLCSRRLGRVQNECTILGRLSS